MIVKRVVILESGFVGTRLSVSVTGESPSYGLAKGVLSEGSSSVRVDWGDGSSESLPGFVELTHVYPQAGSYEISLSDDLSMLSAALQEDDSPFSAAYPPCLVLAFSNAAKLTSLGPYCFRNAVNLVSADFADSSVTSLGAYSFCDCASLAAMDRLPRNLTSVGAFAFCRCTSLVRVENWPPGVTSLASGVFKGCTGLTGEFDLVGVNLIRGYGSMAPFVDCTGGIGAMHFAAADESSVKGSTGYQRDPTLGSTTGYCLFDR